MTTLLISFQDSDAPGRSPKKKPGIPPGLVGAGGLNVSGPLPQDLGGGPANFGKITSSSALADTDPLGVNPNINFDSVGGLDAHIASLKEMTLLPLLYPEVFQKFGVTPPRGVLFHGPPGTGKTLMARALASSCRSDGRSISFFMRKGADVLSKWVGEAERQLRLLFEEARNSQPSIIFFDEIDGKRKIFNNLTKHLIAFFRSCTCTIFEAGPNSCLHCLYSSCSHGRYGWPWSSHHHRCNEQTRRNRLRSPPSRSLRSRILLPPPIPRRSPIHYPYSHFPMGRMGKR